jgi:RNA polymerase sigma-70 factor (ECF subfamily)
MKVATIDKRAIRARRTDAELLELVAREDLTALGELFDRHHADVRRVLARVLPGSGDVDDLVQATFLALPRAAGNFEGTGSCKPWLSGIAVKLAFRHRRGLGRFLRALASFGDASMNRVERTPEAETSDKQELAIFERALATMSEKKRVAFVLIELEGLTAEEAGRALDIPAATARTRVFHARAELRAAMKRGGAW